MCTIRQATITAALLCVAAAAVEAAAQPADAPATNLTVSAAASQLPAEAWLDPTAAAWSEVESRQVALNRTPPLYDTDPPTSSEIASAEVRMTRASGKLLVRLAWKDPTDDEAVIAKAPATPPEQRRMKEHSEASNRFFDATAVMFPTNLSTGAVSPSLQMGDPQLPVTIYYWNAARGALLMSAQGRGTTKRSGESFPARGGYRDGMWQVTLELPAVPAGVPLAFAVWNGSQQDRDGRKYFSVWYRLQ
ncbi:MAG TPA: hypothetical protein VN812_03720 [Candidatus Acidoferrales bacterium]|nr:hypothetical protein [Candidatus Acidoferrales bacterium]